MEEEVKAENGGGAAGITLILGDDNFTFTLPFLESRHHWPNQTVEVASCLPEDKIPNEFRPNYLALKALGIEVHFGINPAQLRNHFFNNQYSRMIFVLPGISFTGFPEFLDKKHDPLFRLRLHIYMFGFLKSSRNALKTDALIEIVWPRQGERPELPQWVPWHGMDLVKIGPFCEIFRSDADDEQLDIAAFQDWHPLIHNVQTDSCPAYLQDTMLYCWRLTPPPVPSSQTEESKSGDDKDTNLLFVPPELWTHPVEVIPHVNELFKFEMKTNTGELMVVSKPTLKFDPRSVNKLPTLRVSPLMSVRFRSDGAPAKNPFVKRGGGMGGGGRGGGNRRGGRGGGHPIDRMMPPPPPPPDINGYHPLVYMHPHDFVGVGHEFDRQHQDMLLAQNDALLFQGEYSDMARSRYNAELLTGELDAYREMELGLTDQFGVPVYDDLVGDELGLIGVDHQDVLLYERQGGLTQGEMLPPSLAARQRLLEDEVLLSGDSVDEAVLLGNRGADVLLDATVDEFGHLGHSIGHPIDLDYGLERPANLYRRPPPQYFEEEGYHRDYVMREEPMRGQPAGPLYEGGRVEEGVNNVDENFERYSENFEGSEYRRGRESKALHNRSASRGPRAPRDEPASSDNRDSHRSRSPQRGRRPTSRPPPQDGPWHRQRSGSRFRSRRPERGRSPGRGGRHPYREDERSHRPGRYGPPNHRKITMTERDRSRSRDHPRRYSRSPPRNKSLSPRGRPRNNR